MPAVLATLREVAQPLTAAERAATIDVDAQAPVPPAAFGAAAGWPLRRARQNPSEHADAAAR
jgi:hypothetical protein